MSGPLTTLESLAAMTQQAEQEATNDRAKLARERAIAVVSKMYGGLPAGQFTDNNWALVDAYARMEMAK